MTDREKLIELLGEVADRVVTIPTDGFIAYLADHLIASGVRLESKTSDKTSDSKWISVGDRLPERDGTYIVRSDNNTVYPSHFYAEMQFDSIYTRKAGWTKRGKTKVTHWMPMPEPPREET